MTPTETAILELSNRVKALEDELAKVKFDLGARISALENRPRTYWPAYVGGIALPIYPHADLTPLEMEGK